MGLFIAGCCHFRGRRQRQNLGPATQSFYMPCHRSPAMLALPPARNPGTIQGLLPTPPLPRTQLGLLPTPSPTIRHPSRPLHVASLVVPPPTRGPIRLLQLCRILQVSPPLPQDRPSRFVCRPCPPPAVALFERQPSAPFTPDRRVEQRARQTGISSLHG